MRLRRTEKFWPGAPDLAVEIVSPSDRFRDVQEKVLKWIAADCVAVLVIDPDKHRGTVEDAWTKMVLGVDS